MPIGGLFVGVGEGEQAGFGKAGAGEHEADGEAFFGEAAGEGNGGDAEGVEVAGVFEFGVAGFVRGFTLEGGVDGAGGTAAGGQGDEVDVLGGEGIVDGAAEELELPLGLDVFGGFGIAAGLEGAADGELVEAAAAAEVFLVPGVGFAATTGAFGGRKADVFERGSEGGKHADGLFDGGEDVGVAVVKVRGAGDAEADVLDGFAQEGGVVGGLGFDAGNVEAVIAGEGVEQEGGVFDGAGHGAAVIAGEDQRDDAADGDETIGGLETDDGTIAGGGADAAAGVGAEGAEAEIGGDGGGAAAGGAAGVAGEIPGVADGPEVTGDGGAAEGEFVEVELAEEDGASLGEAAGDFGVFGGDTIVEDGAGAGGADAGGVDVVFESDGNAVEGTADTAGGNFGIGRAGSGEGLLAEDGDESVDLGVVSVDAGEAGFSEGGRGERAVAQAGGGLGDGEAGGVREGLGLKSEGGCEEGKSKCTALHGLYSLSGKRLDSDGWH